MRCGDDHWYRKFNVPDSLEELAGQHPSTWPHVTPVVGNMPGAPPITPASSKSSVGSARTPYPRPVPGVSGARATGASTVQRGPLHTLARSMIDLQHRVTGLECEPSPASSLSPPLLSLGATSSVVPPVSDSIIIEGPGVTVSLDYVPPGIYQGRRVWSVSAPEKDS
jgi:hypothetical protein